MNASVTHTWSIHDAGCAQHANELCTTLIGEAWPSLGQWCPDDSQDAEPTIGLRAVLLYTVLYPETLLE